MHYGRWMAYKTFFNQSMNEQTFSRRLYQLVIDVHNHSHCDELLQIMTEQVIDDTNIVAELG